MAVKNLFFNKGSSKNYKVRVQEDGIRIFATECEATEPGAIKFIHSKNGNNFKAGDPFYATGGNVINGVLNGAWVKDGFKPSTKKSVRTKELTLGFKSVDKDNNVTVDFLQLPLLNDEGRINSDVARLLVALNKADLGEDLSVVIHTFKHKAGDVMNEKTGVKWEKDGYNTKLSAYQDHKVTDENKRGIIKVEKDELYVQPKRYEMDGEDFSSDRVVVQITPETKVPEGAVIRYNTEDAAAFYTGIVAAINSKIGVTDKDAPTESASNTVDDDDMQFSDDDDMQFGDDDESSRSRMGNRLS